MCAWYPHSHLQGHNLHHCTIALFISGDLLLQFARRVGKTQREDKAASDGEAEEREDGLCGRVKKIRKSTAFEFTRRERFVNVRRTPPFFSAAYGQLPRHYDSIVEGAEEGYGDEEGEEGGGDILVNQSGLTSNSSTASLVHLGCSIDDDETFNDHVSQERDEVHREKEEQVGLCLTEIDSDSNGDNNVMKTHANAGMETDTLSRRTYSDCSATTTEECHTISNACASDNSLISNLSTSTSTSCTTSISTSITSDVRTSIPVLSDDKKENTNSMMKNKNVFEDAAHLIQPTVIKAEKKGKQTQPSFISHFISAYVYIGQ